MTEEYWHVWLAEGSRPPWSLLTECGRPWGDALGKVAQRADREGGHPGTLSLEFLSRRKWSRWGSSLMFAEAECGYELVLQHSVFVIGWGSANEV